MRSHRWAGAVAVVALVTSCAGGSPGDAGSATTERSDEPTTVDESPPSTSDATDPTTTDPTTTERTTTSTSTVAPATTEDVTASTEPPEPEPAWPVGDGPLVRDELTCEPAWTDLTRPEGELTFARGGALFGVDPATGEATCLATLDRDPSALDWNPSGDRLLIDSDLLLTVDGVEPSGFERDRADVAWSQPRGTALISPAPDGSELRHVDTRNGSVGDIASLATTWAAAYHPSGLAVVSAGVAETGEAGLFLADNVGGQRSQLVFLDDPATTITDVEFEPDGSAVLFVHDHRDSPLEPDAVAHVHRLELATMVLTDVAALADGVPQPLRISEQADGTATWPHGNSTASSVLDIWRGTDVESLRLPDHRVDVVGTIDGGTIAAIVRPLGDSVTGDLWLLAPDADPVLVARDVTAATTRTERSSNWSEPPLDIEQRAVG